MGSAINYAGNVLIMKNVFLLIFLHTFIVGCGIFTPRDSFEEPAWSTPDDPFNYNEILSSVGRREKIVSTDPDELFDDKMSYIDNNIEKKYPKKDFVSNIRILKQQYNFTVTWGDSTKENPVQFSDDTLRINKISYKVVFAEKGSSINKIEIGECDFKLVGKPSAMKISSWVNIPDKNVGRSFFTPLFGSE